MIPINDAIRSVLASGVAWCADLFTLTLVSGQVFRFTNADCDVSWQGNTWLCPAQGKAPLIERGEINFETGLTVDQLTLDLYTDERMTICGMQWPHAIRAGLLDAAEVSLDRAIAPLGGKVAGIIPRFTGRVGPSQPGKVHSVLTIDSHLAYLRAPVPRNVYQPGCANTIYDAACGLDRNRCETLVTIVSSGNSPLHVKVSPSLNPERFASGFARFVSAGSNNSQQVTVRNNDGDSITLLYPFPASLQAGDQLALAPGCQKTLAACRARSNLARFRGHPHVPVPETML